MLKESCDTALDWSNPILMAVTVSGYVARIVSDGFAWALCGTSALALGMSFLMPSAMGRVLLMLPIIQGLAHKLGYEDDTRGYTGIVLTGLFASFMPSMSILPANIPNMVLIGAAEAVALADDLQHLTHAGGWIAGHCGGRGGRHWFGGRRGFLGGFQFSDYLC